MITLAEINFGRKKNDNYFSNRFICDEVRQIPAVVVFVVLYISKQKQDNKILHNMLTFCHFYHSLQRNASSNRKTCSLFRSW